MPENYYKKQSRRGMKNRIWEERCFMHCVRLPQTFPRFGRRQEGQTAGKKGRLSLGSARATIRMRRPEIASNQLYEPCLIFPISLALHVFFGEIESSAFAGWNGTC